MTIRALILALLAAALGLGGCAAAAGNVTRIPAGVELAAGPAVARSGVAEPDPRLTPGAVFAGATVAAVCRPGYARRHRDVSVALERQVFRAYGVTYRPGRYEVDHLVPLEVGGANVGRDPRTGRVVATANLWPQPSRSAAVKDRLENRLHEEVCAGRIGLGTAQREIARDWYGAWLAEGRP